MTTIGTVLAIVVGLLGGFMAGALGFIFGGLIGYGLGAIITLSGKVKDLGQQLQKLERLVFTLKDERWEKGAESPVDWVAAITPTDVPEPAEPVNVEPVTSPRRLNNRHQLISKLPLDLYHNRFARYHRQHHQDSKKMLLIKQRPISINFLPMATWWLKSACCF